MRSVEVRLEIVSAKTAHRDAGGVRIKMRRADLCDFAPGGQFRWSDVFPILSAVARDPDEAIISSGPDRIHIFKRWRQRVDCSALFSGLRIQSHLIPHAGGHSRSFACEIWADRLPGMTAVAGGKQYVSRVVKQMRIKRRKHDRLGTVSAIFAANRNWRYVLGLPGAPMKAGNFTSAGSVNDVGIKWIRRNVAVFNYSDRVPIAKRDAA